MIVLGRSHGPIARMKRCALGLCQVRNATELAVLVRRLEQKRGLRRDYWIPRSQLMEGNECVHMGDVGPCFATPAWRERLRSMHQDAQARVVRKPNLTRECITAISLRHIDAGDDFRDPLVTARIAAEVTDECAPILAQKD